MTSLLLAQGIVPPLNPAQGREWIPSYDRLLQGLNGLALGGLLVCLATVILGGATWAVAGRSGHTGGVAFGKGMVLSGFVGAIVIGMSSSIVNTGVSLGG